ncbi:MAG: hypothetical protein HYX41_06965 [Bdellovibrio sp.]|nr:hypothetical protein [Bdellovibrio sp.]
MKSPRYALVLGFVFLFCFGMSCGKESPNVTPPSDPSVNKKTKIRNQLRSFQITDVQGESTFTVQIDDNLIGTTPKGGSLEKNLALAPGGHTITLTRISGPVKEGQFMIVLNSQEPYYFQLYSSGVNIQMLKGPEAGVPGLADELGYRIAKGRLFLTHSVTLKVTVEADG